MTALEQYRQRLSPEELAAKRTYEQACLEHARRMLFDPDWLKFAKEHALHPDRAPQEVLLQGTYPATELVIIFETAEGQRRESFLIWGGGWADSQTIKDTDFFEDSDSLASRFAWELFT